MLSFAKCGHCNQTGTKIAEISPSGGNYKQNAICCISCSAILGVVGYYDAGQLIKNQEAQINSMVRQVGDLTRLVQTLHQEVLALRRGQR